MNRGFEGRVFLTQSEWETYQRRGPVRHSIKAKSRSCDVCGEPGIDGNRVQIGHAIGYAMGVVQLGLTPDWLDSDVNLVAVHRKSCKTQSAISTKQAIELLEANGISSLPSYLPKETLDLFDA